MTRNQYKDSISSHVAIPILSLQRQCTILSLLPGRWQLSWYHQSSRQTGKRKIAIRQIRQTTIWNEIRLRWRKKGKGRKKEKRKQYAIFPEHDPLLRNAKHYRITVAGNSFLVLTRWTVMKARGAGAYSSISRAHRTRHGSLLRTCFTATKPRSNTVRLNGSDFSTSLHCTQPHNNRDSRRSRFSLRQRSVWSSSSV